jgi:hypothetical protein
MPNQQDLALVQQATASGVTELAEAQIAIAKSLTRGQELRSADGDGPLGGRQPTQYDRGSGTHSAINRHSSAPAARCSYARNPK